MRTKLSALILAVTLSVGCAGNGPLRLADYSQKLAATAEQAQQVVLKADETGLNPNKDVTARIMAAFRELGVQLGRVADGLTLYDSISGDAKQDQAATLRGLIAEARRLTLVVMGLTTGNDALGAQVLGLFDNLNRTMDEIVFGLSQ